MDIAEFIELSTIRIETSCSSGMCGFGTGFFFAFKQNKDSGEYCPAIVTNKHVVKGAKKGVLTFLVKNIDDSNEQKELYCITLDNFEKLWINHPDPNVDLCIFPIAGVHRILEKVNKVIQNTYITFSDIPSINEYRTEFSQIEDIVVVGYPCAIYDSVNNMPIVRRGITATPLQNDFNNSSCFLVDAAIYPGSSGSPVFVYNRGAYSQPNGGLVVANRLKFVGIISSIFMYTAQGEIKLSEIPTAMTSIPETRVPNNLGIAIHARKLIDFDKIEW